MTPEEYLAETKARLVASPAVASIDIVEERALPDRGYFRARLRAQQRRLHFPHHVHVGEESNVVPGRLLSTMDLIDLIELDQTMRKGAKVV